MNHTRIRIPSHRQSRLPHNLVKDGWWLDDKPIDHEVRVILLPGRFLHHAYFPQETPK